jgi:transposase
MIAPSFYKNWRNVMCFLQRIRALARFKSITNLSHRKLAELLGCSHPTVCRDSKFLQEYRLDHETIQVLDDDELLLIVKPNYPLKSSKFREPDWDDIFTKMQVKHQTLMNIWLNYVLQDPVTAMKKSSFYVRFRQFCKVNKVSMLLEHAPGEECQIDYAGQTVPLWIDSGKKKIKVSVFFGAMCYSKYLFIYATLGQTTNDWVSAQIAFFNYLGGKPQVVIPDNPRALVTKPRPHLKLNAKYEAFGHHFTIAIMPARPIAPQDKAIAEESVRFGTERVLVNMQTMKFFSLKEMNDYLRKESDKLNRLRFQKSNTTREEVFLRYDKPLLKELPENPFRLIEAMFSCNASTQYRIYYKEHSYSVPWQWANKKCEVKVTAESIFISYKNKPEIIHVRDDTPRVDTCDLKHLHPKHRHMVLQTQQEFITWAENYGEAALGFIDVFFNNKPERSTVANEKCKQFQYLAKQHSHENFELACDFTRKNLSMNITSLKQVLASELYLSELDEQVTPAIHHHEFVRGSTYYNDLRG